MLENETIKNNITELEKSDGELFQIIKTKGEILHLKGEDTGQDITVSMTELFRSLEKGKIKLRKKPIPIIKIDGRKRKRIISE